jgi:hypothetical protein
MPYPLHSVKVETQVVDGVQDLCQHFVRCIKVTKIGPRVALAHPTAAVGVNRRWILGVARLLNRDFPFRGKQEPVPRRAGRKDAIHHVDAQAGVLDNLFGSAHSHQITRLVGG